MGKNDHFLQLCIRMVEVWVVFFIIFHDGNDNNNNKSSDDVHCFSFLLQCSLVVSLTRFELVGDTKVFLMDATLLWEGI